MELGEWFRRQSAKTRGSVLEHVSVVGGGNPMQMAIRGGSAAALDLLIDAAWKDAGVGAGKALTKVGWGGRGLGWRVEGGVARGDGKAAMVAAFRGGRPVRLPLYASVRCGAWGAC